MANTSSSSSAPNATLMAVPQNPARETSEQRAYKALLLGSSSRSSSVTNDDLPGLYSLPPSPSSSSEDEEEHQRYHQRERAFAEAGPFFAELWEGLKVQRATKRAPYSSRRVPRRERRHLNTTDTTNAATTTPVVDTTTDDTLHPPRRVHYRVEITSMAHIDSYPTPWS